MRGFTAADWAALVIFLGAGLISPVLLAAALVVAACVVAAALVALVAIGVAGTAGGLVLAIGVALQYLLEKAGLPPGADIPYQRPPLYDEIWRDW
jgi:hypothetical protein